MWIFLFAGWLFTATCIYQRYYLALFLVSTLLAIGVILYIRHQWNEFSRSADRPITTTVARISTERLVAAYNEEKTIDGSRPVVLVSGEEMALYWKGKSKLTHLEKMITASLWQAIPYIVITLRPLLNILKLADGHDQERRAVKKEESD